MLKTVGNIAKEAIKARVTDVKITCVSSYRYPVTKSSNRTPVIAHPRDRVSRQISARRTNHDREFCYRYDYFLNCTPFDPITITYQSYPVAVQPSTFTIYHVMLREPNLEFTPYPSISRNISKIQAEDPTEDRAV